MELFEQYEVVAREGGDFEFRHKGGAVLLVTQRVSLDTLITLALEDEIIP